MHHDDHNIHFEYFNLHRPILKENLPCWRRRKPLLWTGLSCWKWRCLMERCQRHGQRVTSPSGAQEGLWAMWPLELTVLPPIRVRIFFCATILHEYWIYTWSASQAWALPTSQACLVTLGRQTWMLKSWVSDGRPECYLGHPCRLLLTDTVPRKAVRNHQPNNCRQMTGLAFTIILHAPFHISIISFTQTSVDRWGGCYRYIRDYLLSLFFCRENHTSLRNPCTREYIHFSGYS